ncbi:MAG: hypothetical protein IPK00_16600 [Deltaproteobacteria bacterium]|nr:hypothetical protein [Deltaproteobacteria bacterium]
MRDRPKVGEILVQAGIIDELQLASALGEQSRWGRRLGMTLIKLGMVQEGHLVRALARQYDMPVASLAGKKIAPEVIALVPAKLAIEHSVVPLFVKKEGRKSQLFLGMEEPSDLGILDDLAFHTGMSIRPVMVGPTELGEAIDRYYNARPAPVPTRMPDPMRGADTLSENNLRSLREEAAPTLSELLKPAPAAVSTPAAVVGLPAAALVDATPLVPAVPDPDPDPDAGSASDRGAEPELRREPDPVRVAPAPAAVARPLPEPMAPVAMPTAPAPSEVVREAVAPLVPPVIAVPVVSPPVEAQPGSAPVAVPSDAFATEVARAVEETERTRLVAKAIAHLLIEKGILTLDELQARIEKMKPTRPGTAE